MTDVESHILASDQEGIKGIALQKEKYVLIQEKLKLIMHYFKHYVKLNLKDEEFLKVRVQLIQKGLEISDDSILEKMRQDEEEAVNNQQSTDENRGNLTTLTL